MNRGIKMSAMIDNEFDELEVDMNVIDVSPHEVLALFGTLMGYVLRDYFDKVDEDDDSREESLNLMLITAIETYSELMIDRLLEELKNKNSNESVDDTNNVDTEINFDINQMDDAINKMLKGFENGK